MEENVIPNGVHPDIRSDEEKAKDHKHLAGAVSLNWQELDLTKLKLPSQRIQDGSYSCCFQSAATALEKLTGKVASAVDYFQRKNYPAQGAWLQDVGDITKNKLTAFEVDSNSQNQNEVTMNQKRPYTANIGCTGYRQPAIKNIEQIAEAIDAYGQCLLTFESNGSEWDAPNKTPVYNGTPTTFGHCICSLTYGLLNRVRVLVCLDSAGQWSSANGMRIITEDFLSHRNTGALYFIGAVDKSVLPDPIIHDTITLDNGSKISTSGLTSFFNEIKAFLTKLGITFKETIGNMLK
jgi:hypothetical protein